MTSDIMEKARLVQRVNAHWSDSICKCEECTEERFDLIDPMADEIERLRTDYVLLSDDYKQLLGDNERLREQAKADRLVVDEAYANEKAAKAEIERLRSRVAEAEAAVEAAGRCLVMSNNGAAEALKILRGFKQPSSAPVRESCACDYMSYGDYPCQSKAASPADTARYYCRKTGLPVGASPDQPTTAREEP